MQRRARKKLRFAHVFNNNDAMLHHVMQAGDHVTEKVETNGDTTMRHPSTTAANGCAEVEPHPSNNSYGGTITSEPHPSTLTNEIDRSVTSSTISDEEHAVSSEGHSDLTSVINGVHYEGHGDLTSVINGVPNEGHTDLTSVLNRDVLNEGHSDLTSMINRDVPNEGHSDLTSMINGVPNEGHGDLKSLMNGRCSPLEKQKDATTSTSTEQPSGKLLS